MKALCCSLLLGLAAGPSAAAEPVAAIEFVRPRSLATVVGKTVIELGVRVPEGGRVRHVLVLADGKTIATLAKPPWEVSWDAGDSTEPHFLEAVLVLSDGAEVRASTRTSPLRIDQYEQVSLVNLYATVRDKQQNYISSLTRERFRVSENGRPQTIVRFSDEWKPLRVALVLDSSLSMEGEKLEAAREAALTFLEGLRPGDQGMVASFNDAVQIVQPFTSDRSALSAAIRKTRAQGGTALYDAVWTTADLLERFDGRRVIVLLSDGRDEAASGLEPGSLHTEEEALDRALRCEAMIFAIGFGRNLGAEWDFFRRRSLASILGEMAGATGGRAIFSSRAGKLRKAFDEVAEDLRHQYSLAYTSDDPKRDGSWREIRVTTDEPGLVVVTRRGYFAPRDSESAPLKR